MRIFFTLIFLLINYFNFCIGQKTYTPEFADPLLDNFRWRHIEELSGRSFNKFCEGKNGEMWFGVRDAVLHYDGYNWTDYVIPEEKKGVGNIRAMAYFNDTLLIGGAGMQMLVDEKWSKIFHNVPEEKRFSDAASRGRIFFRDFVVTNNALIGARSYGVYVKRNGKEHFYTNSIVKQRHDTILTDLIFHVIDVFGEGLKHNCSNILDCGDGTYYAFFSNPSVLPHHFKFRLTENDNDPLEVIPESRNTKIKIGGPCASIKRPNGEMWVVSESSTYGLNILQNNEWKLFSFKKNLSDTEVSWNILSLSDGSVLITSLGVIYRYYNGEWSKISSPDIPFKSIHVHAEFSKNGDLWLGEEKGEVYKIDYNTKHYSIYNNLNYQFTDNDSSLWFISNNEEVVVKKNSEWYYYDQSDGLISAPQTLFRAKNGILWCGGSHNQIAATAFLLNHKWIKQLHDSLSWGINFNAVQEDNMGGVWFAGAANPKTGLLGQRGGLVKIEIDKNFNAKPTYFYFKRPWLYSLLPDENGNMFAGTSYGYYLFNEQSLNAEKPEDKIKKINDGPNALYNRIYKTNTGTTWAATTGTGVRTFHGETKGKSFTTQDGINSNIIIDIYPANDSSVCIATNKGFSYYNGIGWNNNIFPEEFHFGFESGKLSGDNNKIWISKFPLKWTRRVYEDNIRNFPSQQFFSVMYKPDTIPPNTVITHYNKEVDVNGATTIEWTGIDYQMITPTEKLVYSFRLNNQEWSVPNAKTNVNLTGLQSGEYTFEVKAGDADMNFDSTPSKVVFTVAYPIWKRPWFIIMVLSFITTVVYLITRIIVRNKKLVTANVQIQAKQEEIYTQNEELSRHRDHLELIVDQRTQELQKAKERAENADKLKSAFLANISHEIRTPMNAIVGFSNILENEDIDEIERRKYRKIISKNSESLMVLLNDIMDISLIEANQISIKASSFNVNTLLIELENYGNLNKKENVEICLVQDKIEEPVYINTDYERLKQILSNLVNNAIKYTNKGSVKFGYTINDGKIRFFVADTGIGIDKDKFDHIFNSFCKVEDDVNSLFRGAGIGLTITKKLVDLLGGAIWLESEKNKYTRFYVELPFIRGSKTSEEPKKKANRKTYNWEDLTVLVAEDESANFIILENILLRSKAKVVWVKDGQEVVDYVKEHPKHTNFIVLMDIKMPTMDGIEALKLIHEINIDIPIIAVSAYAFESEKEKILSHKFAGYITKPINSTLLLECINENIIKE